LALSHTSEKDIFYSVICQSICIWWTYDDNVSVIKLLSISMYRNF